MEEEDPEDEDSDDDDDDDEDDVKLVFSGQASRLDLRYVCLVKGTFGVWTFMQDQKTSDADEQCHWDWKVGAYCYWGSCQPWTPDFTATHPDHQTLAMIV